MFTITTKNLIFETLVHNLHFLLFLLYFDSTKNIVNLGDVNKLRNLGEEKGCLENKKVTVVEDFFLIISRFPQKI